MSETTKDRLPVHQNQRSQPSIVRSTEPKKRVLPDNKTHMYKIAIPKKKLVYCNKENENGSNVSPLHFHASAHSWLHDVLILRFHMCMLHGRCAAHS
jgi:hypothetical protein